jgi:hypothetical protein
MAWEDVLHFYILRTGPQLMTIVQCIDDEEWMRISIDDETGGLGKSGIVRIEGTEREILQRLDSCDADWSAYLRLLD